MDIKKIDWSNKQQVLKALKKKNLELDGEYVDTTDFFGRLNPKLRDDEEVIIAMAQSKHHFNAILPNLSEPMRDNKKVVMAILTYADGSELEYASERLRDDKDVVLAAIQTKAEQGISPATNIRYASDRLKDDKDCALAAVKRGTRAYSLISQRLQDDFEIENAYHLQAEQESATISNDRQQTISLRLHRKIERQAKRQAEIKAKEAALTEMQMEKIPTKEELKARNKIRRQEERKEQRELKKIMAEKNRVQKQKTIKKKSKEVVEKQPEKAPTYDEPEM